MGVKVTLLRTSEMGKPTIRTFEAADEWDFDYDGNLSTLMVMNGVDVLYELPTSNVESVEFASKETA